ncbi:MAG: hypothetical protein LBN39_00750 [Planctomycetaceae bacterium]|jgi:hypothetical protein|nr:hypothetical protein [Planctomycetaceae bacterium]
MTKRIFFAILFVSLCPFLAAQHHVPHNDAAADFHAGLHSGSWTLQRKQILDWESKDKYRSCTDPFCERCSKHLADYGHEYQYLTGPKQRQIWYRGTIGTIAPVIQYGYDQHGKPYTRRGLPAAVMSWEYARTLNHAIWEQIEAHNAVAVAETAEDRLAQLNELRDIAKKILASNEAKWKQLEQTGQCIGCQHTAVGVPCAPVAAVPAEEQTAEPQQTLLKPCCNPCCEYCNAWRQYQKDLCYVASVEQEIALITQDWQYKTLIADEKVRIALLSKDDADKATRFKRIQHKPPKYKEVLAAKAAEEAAKKRTEAQTPKLAEEEDKTKESEGKNSGNTEDIVELPKN